MWHSQPAELPPEGCRPVKACTDVCKGTGAATLVLCSGQQGCLGPGRSRLLRGVLLPELLAAALTQLTVMGEQSPAPSPVS